MITSKKHKIVSIVGARPQFIKAAALGKQLRYVFHEVTVHTGQHYSNLMSGIFFEQLKLSKPHYNLGIGSGNHGEQTGKILVALERVLLREKPHLVLVYGDTNSTLAGALAAAKLHIPLAHVEAGLRSYNRDMPEEINRVVTDHLSQLLFCPTRSAVASLKKEGIVKGVHFTGDVMLEIFLEQLKKVKQTSNILRVLRLKPKSYFLLTLHRAENTDNKNNLRSIIKTLLSMKHKIVFPVHPRTKKYLKKYDLWQQVKNSKNVLVIEPVSYLDMIQLEKEARLILTDSGGVQKEAYFLKVPTVTLRKETEWTETLKYGWNTLLRKNDKKTIAQAINKAEKEKPYHPYFGFGDAPKKIVRILDKFLKKHA